MSVNESLENKTAGAWRHLLFVLGVAAIAGCGGGGSSNPGMHNAVVANWSTAGVVQGVVGGNQTVNLTFTSTDGLPVTGFQVTSDLSVLPAGWTGPPNTLICAQLSSGNGCVLALRFAPTTAGNGTLRIAYRYSDNAGQARTGATSIAFAATIHNHVINTVLPIGQIAVANGASAVVTILFTTDDGSAASDLEILTSLASLPAGWTSSSTSFSCAAIHANGCLLTLTYAPTQIASGTLVLDYSYIDNAGAAQSALVSLPYTVTDNNNVVATATPAGAVLAVAGGAPRTVALVFTTDDGRNATGLQITGGLNPPAAGWSGPLGFSCALVNSGSSCTLNLVYAPTVPGAGTLSLTYRYTNAAGSVKTGTASIPYATTLGDTVGGTVSGLRGSGLALQNNGSDDLGIPGSGNFTFATSVASGGNYAVTVKTQPANPAQLCTVFHGAGTIAGANINSVAVSCVNMAKLMFVTNPYDLNGDGSLAAFTINPGTGVLTATAGSPYTPAGIHPFALAADPSGQYLYVANAASASVSTYGIGAGGDLTPELYTAVTGGLTNEPISLALDPSGPYLIVGSNENAIGQLEVFAINAGALTPASGNLSTSTYLAGNVPTALVFDPVQSLIFDANYFDGTMSGYTIDAGGALTAVAGSPFVFQNGGPMNQPYAQALHPGGEYLYVTDAMANTVSQYGYDDSGELTFKASHAVGGIPQGVAIDPLGKFLYVSNSGDGTVSAFAIDANGALAAIPGSPFVASGIASTTPTAVSVAVTSFGEFVYMAGADSGMIYIFSLAGSTGVLTSVGAPVSTIIAGGGPTAIAIE